MILGYIWLHTNGQKSDVYYTRGLMSLSVGYYMLELFDVVNSLLIRVKKIYQLDLSAGKNILLKRFQRHCSSVVIVIAVESNNY